MYDIVAESDVLLLIDLALGATALTPTETETRVW
jgi:hypothetical protein